MKININNTAQKHAPVITSIYRANPVEKNQKLKLPK
jgi:hypothetical protein